MSFPGKVVVQGNLPFCFGKVSKAYSKAVGTFALNDAVREGCLCTKFHGKCLVCLTPLRK